MNHDYHVPMFIISPPPLYSLLNFMIQDGIIGELSLTKPFIGCYLGSEFSELSRPLLDNESRNLSQFPQFSQKRPKPGIDNVNRPQR